MRCLCDLLHNCGIYCYTDLCHINENNTDINWPHWVYENLKSYIAYPYCHVILVCSPIMNSLLDERNTDYIEMVTAHFHSHILGHYLQRYAEKFLPLLINDPSTDYVPASLKGQECYYFPYYKLNEMPENISTHDVIHHPNFSSLKSLVDMLLTGQQETPVADQGRLYNSIHQTLCSAHGMSLLIVHNIYHILTIYVVIRYKDFTMY